MSDEKGNESQAAGDIGKLGVYVNAQRASDNVNPETDKEGSGKGLERFYPKLGGDDKIGKLRAMAKLHFYTKEVVKGEDYIFFNKNTKTEITDDNVLIKDVAVISVIDSDEEKKSETPAQKFTIYAKKVYPTETPGETAEAANKLVEEVTKLDTKAFYAVGAMDGCQIVLTNILKLLSTVFAEVNKDPLLQTLVTMASYDSTKDKATIDANKIALKKLLLEMGSFKPSEIQKVNSILGLVLAGLNVAELLKWGTKKVYKRVTKNRKVYEGPATKWRSRFNGAKAWGKKAFSAGMKFASAALNVASIGLTIYGIASEKAMEAAHWRKVCEQLIEQKNKRYDEYEDIYTRYNDLSDTMWMLRHQFVTNFSKQCTPALLNNFGDLAPSIAAMKEEGDKALKALIEEVMGSLTNIQKYLYGLVKDFNRIQAKMETFEDFNSAEKVKDVAGYNYFIKKEKEKGQVSDAQMGRYIDVYALFLLDAYYKVIDDSKYDKILDYDSDLRKVMDTFPKNENSIFGQKNVDLKKSVQETRMTYLWFHGANQNSDSTNDPNENKAVVKFSFAQKVQDLYNK